MSGWTPITDDLVRDIGLIPALVYSRIVRYCKMSSGKCYASLASINDGLGLSNTTICDTLAALVAAGYLTRVDADKPRTPHTYFPTDKYDLWKIVSGSNYTPDVYGSTPSVQDNTPRVHNYTPRVSKKHIKIDINKDIKRDEPATQFLDERPANNDKNATEPISPVPVIPLAGYPSRNSPVAVAQRKVDALVKKSVAKSSADIVSGWPPGVESKVTAYVHAYFRGVAPDGANVRRPDAVTLIKQNGYVMDIDPAIFSPKDFEDAARYYWRAWKGMLSLKRLRSELSEWDARGRPKAKVAEQRGVTKNYAEIAAAEQAEWERLGCPKGWKPE
jgi:hypothetical protein